MLLVYYLRLKERTESGGGSSLDSSFFRKSAMAYFQEGSLGLILIMSNSPSGCPERKILEKRGLQKGWLYECRKL
jgi:hypothetical protein